MSILTLSMSFGLVFCAHLHGCMPLAEIDKLPPFWPNYPGLRESIFTLRDSIVQNRQANVDFQISGHIHQQVTFPPHNAKLRQQKQGLMHDLLTGRVRVDS